MDEITQKNLLIDYLVKDLDEVRDEVTYASSSRDRAWEEIDRKNDAIRDLQSRAVTLQPRFPAAEAIAFIAEAVDWGKIYELVPQPEINKIPAIKHIREQTGLGLLLSKQVYEHRFAAPCVHGGVFRGETCGSCGRYVK